MSRAKVKKQKARDIDGLADILTQAPFLEAEFYAFKAEILSGSDRATAIVAASYVETALDMSIITHLTNIDQQTFKDLTRPPGPLSSFSAKITLGYSMGLYSLEIRKDLDNIRAIRNEFAHRLNMSSFKDKAVEKLCHSFQSPLFPRIVQQIAELNDKIEDEKISVNRKIYVNMALEFFGILNRAADHSLSAWKSARDPSIWKP